MKMILSSTRAFVLLVAFILASRNDKLSAQSVQIQIDISSAKTAVSPYIYGRNNSLSDDPGSPVSAANWQLYKDAGVNFFRENGGNDLSKHNWRLNLSSHPDWYNNNVYASDWDFAAQSLQQHIPAAQGMWGFQLIGEAASNNNNNFDDWDYNGSNWWTGVEQNLAGGGIVNNAGGAQATKNGYTSLYLEKWPADSTTGILTHWFGGGGLGLNAATLKYWNMDNEVEIWSSTHDDVMPAQPDAETFMQMYFRGGKKSQGAVSRDQTDRSGKPQRMAVVQLEQYPGDHRGRQTISLVGILYQTRRRRRGQNGHQTTRCDRSSFLSRQFLHFRRSSIPPGIFR